jgi:hypothetical protein
VILERSEEEENVGEERRETRPRSGSVKAKVVDSRRWVCAAMAVTWGRFSAWQRWTYVRNWQRISGESGRSDEDGRCGGLAVLYTTPLAPTSPLPDGTLGGPSPQPEMI